MEKSLVKASYDVVVVGAGVGGLTAAALLSKAGCSVCVVEKEPHVGGYLAGFRRKDFRFDTAIHWLNQCGDTGLVHKLFDILGKDHPVAVPQKRIRRLKGEGFDYLLTNNPDDLKGQLIADFPHEQHGIERFFRSAKRMGQSLNNFGSIFRSEETMGPLARLKHKMRLLQFAIPFIPYLSYSGTKGLIKGLNRFFKDKDLQKLFASETELLSCLIPIGWAYYGDFQSPPHGGSQVIPEWLSSLVHYYGNDIFCSSRVDRILTEGNRAVGVRFKHHGQFVDVRAKHVIAACDVETLYEKMLPAELVPLRLKEKLKQAELYSSSLTISIALDCTTEALGFNEEMIHLAGEDAVPGAPGTGDPATSELSILAPSGRDKSLAPPGQGTLTLYMPAYMDYKDGWSTRIDKAGNYERGAAYRQLKNEVAEIIIARVERQIAPGLRSHILFYEVSTPVTHWRYTGNRNGSIMGAKPGRKNMTNHVAHYQTPVKNLYLGGHWAELGGGVPIAVKAAANATLMVLRKENKPAFHLLAAFMDNRITPQFFLSQNVFKSYEGHWKQALTPAERREQNSPVRF